MGRRVTFFFMSPRALRATLGLVTGLLATLLYLGVRGTGPETGPPPTGEPDPLFADPRPAPELALFDTDGEAVGLDVVGGQVVALFFGYTQCPDVCPITLSQLSRIRGELDPDGTRLRIVFVSLDPVRDTPEVLERYVASFGSDVLAWTAPVEVLRPQVLEYGIGFVYRPRAGGPADSVAPDPTGAFGDDYLVDHTARTFVIDGDGLLRAQLLPDTRSDALRDVLATVLDEG